MAEALGWALVYVEKIVPYAIVVGLLRYTVGSFLSAALSGKIKL